MSTMHISTDDGAVHEITAADLLEGFRKTENLLHGAECTGLESEDGRNRFSLHFRPDTAESPFPLLAITFRADVGVTDDEYSRRGFRTECTRVEVEAACDESGEKTVRLPLSDTDRAWMNIEILKSWGQDVANI